MSLSKYFKKKPPVMAKPGATSNDNDGDEAMPPSSTSRAVEQKMGAKMAAGMPKRKTFGQRIAQRD